MMMTAAGTLTPAKVFVIGAGVAGLQAISTARRLGAVVSGYDVRPAAKEQIQSVGGKAVDLGVDSGNAGNQRGLCPRDGRGFLPPPAGGDGQIPRRQRRADYDRLGSRQKGARAGDGRDGRRHGARFGRRRFGGGARRKL